jgi:hypothetical protein
MDIFPVWTQIDNWVSDYLAQAMISDSAAAICFKHGNISRAKFIFVQQYARDVASAPNRKYMGMFEQEKGIRLDSAFNRLLSFFLKRQSRLIVDEA